MENNNYSIRRRLAGLKTILVSFFVLASLPLVLAGCVADTEANSKSISDYTDADVTSYGDLFEVFWNVMNQRYCDLNEQSLDWDNVYSEYKPKFNALKTFLATSEFTQAEIQADNAKAQQYFNEIVGKIIDQHFCVDVKLPVSHGSYETIRFTSTLRSKDPAFPQYYRWNYILSQLKQDGTAFAYYYNVGGNSDLFMEGGFLKDHPDIYYLGFSNFTITSNYYHKYKQEYLPVNAESQYHLSKQKIADKAKELVSSDAMRVWIEQEATNLLASIDNYLASVNVQTLCKKMVAYENGGDYYGLADYAQNAGNNVPYILANLQSQDDVSEAIEQITTQIQQDGSCQTICSDSNFMLWFVQALAQYLWHEREFNNYWNDMLFTYYHPLVESYRRCFLEPLAKGKINKLILDLRSNGGGLLQDTRFLADYLVSHTATYCYTRKKEDNNPYGYSPWIPQQIIVTENSLGRDIPTAILLDNNSASMAEMTPLILKSQGDHVKIIGRNSAGAQCMLYPNTANNGGWQGNVTSYLNFYMPVTMAKDAGGNLLEAVGITPDYPVETMTEEEINNIKNNTSSARDRDMEKAIEVLQ